MGFQDEMGVVKLTSCAVDACEFYALANPGSGILNLSQADAFLRDAILLIRLIWLGIVSSLFENVAAVPSGLVSLTI